MDKNRSNSSRAFGTIAAIIVALVATSPAIAHGPQPAQVVADFHAALKSQNHEAALALLLPEAAIYESGGAETVAEYGSHHLHGDMAFSAATTLEVLEQAKQIVGDVAWVMTRSRTTGKYQDREIDSTGVETVVLQHVKDGWRIAHIHWSSRAHDK